MTKPIEPEDINDCVRMIRESLAYARKRYLWWKARKPHWYARGGSFYR